MKNKYLLLSNFIITAFLLYSCASIPKGATPVSPFETSQYLGQWYEIARLDFKHERGLNNTTANYSLRDDGKLKVLNRGYDYTDKEWRDSEGKAKFRGDDKVAALKVSFFGPFYSGYNVIDIDPEYKYALVVGSNTKYMWILSRSTTIPDEVKERFLNTTNKLGYDNDALIWVEHNK